MLCLEHADFYYRLGMVQQRADQLGDDIKNEVRRHEAEMNRIRLMSGQPQVTSVIGAPITATPGLSDNKPVYLIRQTPLLNRMFNKLSKQGKRRVITIANGSDFMLTETIKDVLEQERGN